MLDKTKSGLSGRLLSINLFVILSVAGCGSLEFRSHWHTKAVEGGGTSQEWPSAMTQIEGKQAMVGFLNDSDDLYISLVTDDRALQRQVMFRGLTVWFDREGGEEHRFGIRYPIGMEMAANPMLQRDWKGQRNPDDTLQERIPVDTSEAEITGPMDNEQRRVKIIDLRQISVRFNVTRGRLMYELKVPLADNGPDPYSIGTKAGGVIGVGIETAQGTPERPQDEQGRGTMPPGGGGRGGRRGRGGFGGGNERPERTGRLSEPLKLWAKVQLASGDLPDKKQ